MDFLHPDRIVIGANSQRFFLLTKSFKDYRVPPVDNQYL
jgi:UDP-glucose 6-dehydrogenase